MKITKSRPANSFMALRVRPSNATAIPSNVAYVVRFPVGQILERVPAASNLILFAGAFSRGSGHCRGRGWSGSAASERTSGYPDNGHAGDTSGIDNSGIGA